MGEATPILATFQIGQLPVTVHDLTLREEAVLESRLQDMATTALGPLGHYALIKPVLDELAAQGLLADRALYVQEAAHKQMSQEPLGTRQIFNWCAKSPEGVVEVIYHRTRRTHPELDRARLLAVINKANAESVYLDMVEAIASKNTPGDETAKKKETHTS